MVLPPIAKTTFVTLTNTRLAWPLVSFLMLSVTLNDVPFRTQALGAVRAKAAPYAEDLTVVVPADPVPSGGGGGFPVPLAGLVPLITVVAWTCATPSETVATTVYCPGVA